MPKALDLSNQKFNMLTCVEPTSDRAGPSIIWRCLCDCGSVCFKAADTIKDGRSKSCGCHKYKSVNGSKFYLLYKIYQSNAKRRNIEFLISENEFQELIYKDCFYCGKRALQTSKKLRGMYYNGIDRIDNTKGYIKSNCVTCCKVCNRAKDIMTQKEFEDWVIRVFNNLKRSTAQEILEVFNG